MARKTKKQLEEEKASEKRRRMRIAIVKDVLKILKTQPRRLHVAKGYGYLSKRNDSTIVTHKDVNKGEEQLSTRLKNCGVCALGALFVAELDRNDKFSCRDLAKLYNLRPDRQFGVHGIDRSFMVDRLGRYFDEGELRDIENAFEANDHYDFHDQYPDHKKRFIAIMENILRNGGTFDASNERPFLDKELQRRRAKVG